MSSSAATRAMMHESLVTPTHAPVETSDVVMVNEHAAKIAWMQAILKEYEGPLIRYALRITKDPELARDVVQETFLRACRQDQAALDGHLARWLFRVCRNRALDVQRKEQRMSVATDLDLHTLPSLPGPTEQLERHETNSRLLLLLERLPSTQQEVIRLKFQNDMKYREIAEITGHSISNVGFLLHTGLKRLRDLMKDDQ